MSSTQYTGGVANLPAALSLNTSTVSFWLPLWLQVLQTPQPYLDGTPETLDFTNISPVSLVRLSDVHITCLNVLDRPVPAKPAVDVLPGSSQLSPITESELHGGSLACEYPGLLQLCTTDDTHAVPTLPVQACTLHSIPRISWITSTSQPFVVESCSEVHTISDNMRYGVHACMYACSLGPCVCCLPKQTSNVG